MKTRTCRHCEAPLFGKRQVCPDVCRSRQAPVNRCACRRVISARASSCTACQGKAYYRRRKAREAAGEVIQRRPGQGGRPVKIETVEEVERKLAILDALKRRARWAAT